VYHLFDWLLVDRQQILEHRHPARSRARCFLMAIFATFEGARARISGLVSILLDGPRERARGVFHRQRNRPGDPAFHADGWTAGEHTDHGRLSRRPWWAPAGPIRRRSGIRFGKKYTPGASSVRSDFNAEGLRGTSHGQHDTQLAARGELFLHRLRPRGGWRRRQFGFYGLQTRPIPCWLTQGRHAGRQRPAYVINPNAFESGRRRGKKMDRAWGEDTGAQIRPTFDDLDREPPFAQEIFTLVDAFNDERGTADQAVGRPAAQNPACSPHMIFRYGQVGGLHCWRRLAAGAGANIIGREPRKGQEISGKSDHRGRI